MIRLAVEFAIRRLRGDRQYSLDPAIATRDILSVVWYRGWALIRAQFKLIGVEGSRWRFVESGCAIRHRRFLTVGSGSVLEHGARLSCLGRTGVRIGDGVTIGKYSLIECTSVLWNIGEGVEIGDGSSVGDYSFVGCAAGVTIGNNVLMGQRVSFHSQNHRFDDLTRPIRSQGVTGGRIVIGDDCWLGSGSIILSGVAIGPGSVVAAGSVVTKSFGAGSVIAGVPARLVRMRDRDTPAPDGVVSSAPDLDRDGASERVADQ